MDVIRRHTGRERVNNQGTHVHGRPRQHPVNGHQAPPHAIAGHAVRSLAVGEVVRTLVAGLGQRMVVLHHELVATRHRRGSLPARPDAWVVSVVYPGSDRGVKGEEGVGGKGLGGGRGRGGERLKRVYAE